MLNDQDKIFIVDGVAPFFKYTNKKVINWSKIPFSDLEKEGLLNPEILEQLILDFEYFISRSAELGFTAVTLDDLAHLVLFNFYSQQLQEKIIGYQKLFKRLIDIAKKKGLKVFITTDVIPYNQQIKFFLKHSFWQDFFYSATRELLNNFPEIDGLIIRFGEGDGLDVNGDFKSKLFVKTPGDLNSLIKNLLPLFESSNKLLIVRTWTIRNNAVGDIMWNLKTYQKAFGDIKSDSLVLSMKVGESDFFQYLDLSRTIFVPGHKKIIELQAKREYEGSGMLPSFIGQELKIVHKELMGLSNLSGVSVWTQTGGWSGFRQLTFFENSSLWIELNTFVALKIFKDNQSDLNLILKDFCIWKFGNKFNESQTRKFITLVRLCSSAFRELYYIPEYAEHSLYYKRTRIPTLLFPWWQTVKVNSAVVYFFRHFVKDKERLIGDGNKALKKMRYARQIGQDLGINLDFAYDTFYLLNECRKIIAFEDKTIVRKIKLSVAEYEKKYPEYFKFQISYSKNLFARMVIPILIRLMVRDKQDYRMIDRLTSSSTINWVQSLVLEKLLVKFINSGSKDKAFGPKYE